MSIPPNDITTAIERELQLMLLKEEGKRVLAMAMQYLGDLMSAQASGNGKAAKAALDNIRGLPTPTEEVAGVISGLLCTATLEEVVVQQELRAEDMEAAPAADAPSRSYSGVRCCSNRVQNYFNKELSGSSYASAMAEIKDGKVVGFKKGETLSGAELREAFNDVSKLGMTDDEQKKAEAQGEKPSQPLTQAEASKIGTSLDKLERFRLGQIANNQSLSEEEKAKRAEAVREKFNVARGKLKAAMDIEQRIESAPKGMREAAREGAKPQRDKAHKDLRKSIREDVIEGGLMEEKPEARQKETPSQRKDLPVVQSQRKGIPASESRKDIPVVAQGGANGKIEIPQVPGRTGNVAATTRGGGGMSMA
ncbi:MAG: hypothetical protein EBV03_08050 [Proteobacteria bacterium]|nr:hypothetical protein [Pseudomonadota bacterium]